MADHNAPTLTTAYATFLTNISDRIKDAMLGNDPALVTVTNPPTGTIRWTSASNLWQKWNGTTWVALTATYAISISGNAATATTATAAPWSGITGKPTTLPGYGITDAAPLASPAFTGPVTINGVEAGFRGVPSNTQGGAYTLVATDNGKCIKISTGGVTVPNAVMAADNIVSVYNNSASAQTITQGASMTLRQAGTTNTGNRTLAPRGMATIWFVGASESVISGPGVT